MIKLKKVQCVGCGACKNICPVNAVKMVEDEEGFKYCEIDSDICLDCGSCKIVCPACNNITELFTDGAPLAVYAAWSCNSEMRKRSSSGGIFGELAKEILNAGGYVAGAVFTSTNRVEHCIVDNSKDLLKLQKSKYLQSDTGTIYKDVKDLLLKQKTVLFTGTPCQCAGLLSFLGEKKNNLILCDFVCHGVDSPMIHQKYISEVEQEKCIKIDHIDHRNKDNGWQEYCFKVYEQTQSYDLGSKKENPFLRGFLTNLFLRPSCFECSFKGTSRPTDITLGDCWGFAGDEPEGVSLVLIHNLKGKKLWNMIDLTVQSNKISLDKCIDNNPSIVKSAVDKWGRGKFFYNYANTSKVCESVMEVLGKKYE